MNLGETAELVVNLKLNDKLSGGIRTIQGNLRQLNIDTGKIGGLATQGVKTASRNIAKIGLVAAAGVGAAVKTGLDDLAALESAVTSVDGAIDQMGLTGQITGKQVADWANQIESDIGAAFDDKEITAAATTLLRFGKVTPTNLRPALEVMTDLATKTGGVEGAATLLAKAFAAPEDAAGKLARAGVILTEEQKDQLAAMVKVGDQAGAQALLLDAVRDSTKGAALASQGPYARALSTLADVGEDARKALAEGFLPVIEKVADWLSRRLADPKTIGEIRQFGQDLAGAFDKVLEAAKNIPWGQIKDAMQLAGTGAKAAFDLFTGLPPWIQTAVLTGWGLNKLTGGALGGIVGELGKGLIKGVLGMNAAVVNITAGTVNGGMGGAGGAAGAASNFAGLGVGLAGGGVVLALDQLGQQQAAQLKQTLETTPLTLEEKSTIRGSGLLPVIASMNDPLIQNLAPLVPGLRELMGEIGRVGDSIDSPPPITVAPPSAAMLAQHIAAENGPAFTRVESAIQNLLPAIDSNRDGIASMKEVMANKLGITVDRLSALKEASGGWNATLAAKLGISNDRLQGIKEQARLTKTAINNKNWSPTINTTVKTTFNVSAREIANQITRYRTVVGRQGVGVN